VVEEYPTHTYVNPGSVSIPKEGSPNSYLLLTDEGFTWKDLEGEVYKQHKF
jgi:predicted phosphodiesterase